MSKITSLLFLGLLMTSLSALSLTGCKEASSPPSQKPMLTMVTSGDNPPFEMHDTSQGGGLVGADIDLAQALARKLGLTLEIKDMDFSGLIPALQGGRADFAMALIAPSEERKKNISFSEPYYISRIAVISLSSQKISRKEELAHKKIGVQLGSTHEKTAQHLAQEIPGLAVFSLNKLGDLIQELRTGRIDALLVEEIPAKAYGKAHKDLAYTFLEGYDSPFAIAFPKDSPWVEKFNAALKELKKTGALEKIMAKWLS